MNKLIFKIARKIDPPEPPRTTGQWVRALNGNIVWDPTDLDAPPEHDPTPGILRQLDLIEERRRQRGDCREPTPEQLEDGRRAFEEMIERIRAEGNVPHSVELCEASAAVNDVNGLRVLSNSVTVCFLFVVSSKRGS
jgi:hypothetical protein